jgi:hypothetical protein
MKNVIQLMTGQRVVNTPAVFKALSHSGLVTEKATARNVAILMVAVTAPPFTDLQAYVLDRLNASNGEGDTFGEALVAILNAEPSKLGISQITINTNQPWMVINGFDGSVLEFDRDDFHPQAIRNEAVICGGMIAALNMTLNRAVESGWRE